MNLTRTKEDLDTISYPEEWYKGIMEFSAEDSEPGGTLMIAWIGGRAAQVADTLPDDQVQVVVLFEPLELLMLDSAYH